MAAVPQPANEGIAPPPPGVTPNFVDPPDHQLGIIPLLIVFNTIATIALILRLFTKIHILKFFGWEDAAILLAWACNIAVMVLYLVGIPLHNETHLWDLSIQNYMLYIKPALAVDLLLSPQAGLPKLAILLFYLRINPSQRFKIYTWIIIGITWAFMIAIFCAILFSCNPVHKLWDPTVEGTCLPSLPIIFTVPIVSTVLDLTILILPIPMLIRLRVNLRTKIAVAAIFSAFSCTTVISAVRIGLNARLFGDADITWDASLVGNLTVVENNMMVVCSSVLVLRPFCRRYFPSFLGRDGKPGDDNLSPDEKSPGGELHYDGPSGPQSKSDYRTKIRGGKTKGTKSRNLWSLSFANTTKADDDEDLESFDTELKRLPPTTTDIDGESTTQNTDGIQTPHTKSRDGPALHHGGEAAGQGQMASKDAADMPQVPAYGWNNRAPDADLAGGIVKTVSLDVRGQAF